jgi:pyruvate/2-oxoacid:ferredoxin oxidoreductase alpha subunit
MKKFVAIYLGSAEGLAEWKATDDEKRKEREKAGMVALRLVRPSA